MPRKRKDRSDPADHGGRARALAAQLRKRRKELGVTQEALADLAGCSARFVGALERGKETARLDKLLDVLTALGLELVARPRQVP